MGPLAGPSQDLEEPGEEEGGLWSGPPTPAGSPQSRDRGGAAAAWSARTPFAELPGLSPGTGHGRESSVAVEPAQHGPVLLTQTRNSSSETTTQTAVMQPKRE